MRQAGSRSSADTGEGRDANAHGGSSLAVPSSGVTRTSRGVPSKLRPENLPTAVRKGDVLYAKDRKGRLRLPMC
jgi:hypothetical protein